MNIVDNNHPKLKLDSLVGTKINVLSMDGISYMGMESVPVLGTLEEVSSLGILFRHEKGHLIFASTATFAVMPTND